MRRESSDPEPVGLPEAVAGSPEGFILAKHRNAETIRPSMDDFFDADILIVDDQSAELEIMSQHLRRAGYRRIDPISDSRDVLPRVREQEPDLILLDLAMPHLDGFEVLAKLRENVPAAGYLPIIVVSARSEPAAIRRALSAGARDFQSKPIDFGDLLLRVRIQLETRFELVGLRVTNRTVEQALVIAQHETLTRLALAGEYRDDDTGTHTRRVGKLSSEIARLLGHTEKEVAVIQQAAPLHDIGKIGIPDAILLKPGKLTSEEYAVMRTHAEIGASLLAGGSSDLMVLAEQIAMSHHERWDGAGYPLGLHEDETASAARIVAIADVVDALSHTRPYRAAWPHDRVVREIAANRARHFDPAAADACLEILTSQDGWASWDMDSSTQGHAS